MTAVSQPQLVPRSHATLPLFDFLLARLPIDEVRPGSDPSVQAPGTPSGVSVPGEYFISCGDVAKGESGVTVSIIGEPGAATDAVSGEISQITAADLLALYDTHGRESLLYLRGRWAATIIDPGRGRILLATDRMGRQPLYYRVNESTVLVGNSLASLRPYSVDAGLNTQSLYNYIYFHMVPAPGTVIEGFRKLGAANVLEVTREGQQLSVYWIPSFNEIATVSESAAHKELRVHLRRAVARSASAAVKSEQKVSAASSQADVKVGAFLSGGLDSSTVAGMLSEVQKGEGDAYAIGFDAEGYDEMPFARLAARHFGIRLHEHYVTPDEVVQALPDLAAGFDEPFGNSSVLPAFFCARMAAADGVDVLLAGDGGDELFAGNERYANQRIFEHYRRAPRWLRLGLVEPIVRKLPLTLPLVSKGRSFLRQANTPLPERLQYYSFLEQNNPTGVFSAPFLEHVVQGGPLELLNDIFWRPEDASALNRMLFLDWQITLADNDLRKVDQACALAGVIVRYPMLDDELVDFSVRIPSKWKLPDSGARGRRLRHFYKKAMIGWLPDATINKSKHGFGLPFGVWMKTHKPLQELAYDNILELKTRGIFLHHFLDHAIASHRHGHSAYYGELLWLLMCLELWLAANKPDYRIE